MFKRFILLFFCALIFSNTQGMSLRMGSPRDVATSVDAIAGSVDSLRASVSAMQGSLNLMASNSFRTSNPFKNGMYHFWHVVFVVGAMQHFVATAQYRTEKLKLLRKAAGEPEVVQEKV